MPEENAVTQDQLRQLVDLKREEFIGTVSGRRDILGLAELMDGDFSNNNALETVRESIDKKISERIGEVVDIQSAQMVLDQEIGRINAMLPQNMPKIERVLISEQDLQQVGIDAKLQEIRQQEPTSQEIEQAEKDERGEEGPGLLETLIGFVGAVIAVAQAFFGGDYGKIGGIINNFISGGEDKSQGNMGKLDKNHDQKIDKRDFDLVQDGVLDGKDKEALDAVISSDPDLARLAADEMKKHGIKFDEGQKVDHGPAVPSSGVTSVTGGVVTRE